LRVVVAVLMVEEAAQVAIVQMSLVKVPVVVHPLNLLLLLLHRRMRSRLVLEALVGETT
jgi:hypothetical protein